MPKKKSTPKKKRTGIFIYCSDEFRKRLNRVRSATGRTISGYMMHAALKEIEADERHLSKRN
ncbi:hypothetical protein [Candidatus Korobacter versatilis]|uniref:hypothetical protein n=1 Tax=Candidatus Korobacter versatilis TaxID=658062 RepID=UPI0003032813|nr:hypothetical protein [Candidatus Koribacter versatilis]